MWLQPLKFFDFITVINNIFFGFYDVLYCTPLLLDSGFAKGPWVSCSQIKPSLRHKQTNYSLYFFFIIIIKHWLKSSQEMTFLSNLKLTVYLWGKSGQEFKKQNESEPKKECGLLAHSPLLSLLSCTVQEHMSREWLVITMT